jgi:heme-degrading monooxygenase HmoA/ribosomal protein S18 acetylase RimI-like enzyme
LILEVAILNVRPEQRAEFEAAFARARRIIASAPGCLSHELHRCQEIEGRYVLLVRWDSVASHTEGFRKSADYAEWKRLLHHFYDPVPVVHHYDEVASRLDGELEIRAVDAGAPEAQQLIADLDADLLTRYPGVPTHGIDVDEFRRADGELFLVFVSGVAVACGGYRPISPDTVEIKRMWVPPSHRRLGLSKRLLEKIESTARRRGFTRVVLETGALQPEAILLYSKAGYVTIAKYGEFADDPWSVCFAKSLQ